MNPRPERPFTRFGKAVSRPDEVSFQDEGNRRSTGMLLKGKDHPIDLEVARVFHLSVIAGKTEAMLDPGAGN
jgi:hypothetical protein